MKKRVVVSGKRMTLQERRMRRAGRGSRHRFHCGHWLRSRPPDCRGSRTHPPAYYQSSSFRGSRKAALERRKRKIPKKRKTAGSNPASCCRE